MEKPTTQHYTNRKIKHLEGKHRELDKIIDHNHSDSGPKSWHLMNSLKKQKLAIKDQIAELKTSLSRSTD